MKKIITSTLMLFTVSILHSQPIPFDSEQWLIQAGTKEIEQYKGQQSLRLKGGMAILNDVDFLNGIIEFDIAVANARGFMGVVWRLQDGANFEEFYIRPHQSGKPDANQYDPVYNADASWQLYHGEGYGAPVEYKFDEWMHIKVVVNGTRGEVYVMNMEKPALVIHQMKREVKAGKIGMKCPNFLEARFANFQYQNVENPELLGEFKDPPDMEAGTISSWMVSTEVFDEKTLEGVTELDTKKLGTVEWTELKAEPSGLVNLSEVADLRKGNTVLAKLDLSPDQAEIREFTFGYSDRVRVYLNGKLLYSGNNGYISRDYRYLGTIGYFDSVWLNLKEGENELVLAVSESFGGWGIMGRIKMNE